MHHNHHENVFVRLIGDGLALAGPGLVVLVGLFLLPTGLLTFKVLGFALNDNFGWVVFLGLTIAAIAGTRVITRSWGRTLAVYAVVNVIIIVLAFWLDDSSPPSATGAALQATAVPATPMSPTGPPMMAAAPTATPEVVAEVLRLPTPAPTRTPLPTGHLTVRFEVPIRHGYAMVRIDDREVFRQEFKAPKKTKAEFVSSDIPVEAGDHTMKVWVTSADSREAAQYRAFPLMLGAGDHMVLACTLDSAAPAKEQLVINVMKDAPAKTRAGTDDAGDARP